MESGARFSPDLRHRYILWRTWDWRKPPFVIIMLNPSTADANKLDPTCTRVMTWAAHNGYGSMTVLNVGAGRATEPKDWLAMRDPIGPNNMTWIKRELDGARRLGGGTIVVGWGANAPPEYVKPITDLRDRWKLKLYCFGVTKDGAPRHPLYVARKTELVEWNASASRRENALPRERLNESGSRTKSLRRIMLRERL
jgi:hypothetical protein